MAEVNEQLTSYLMERLTSVAQKALKKFDGLVFFDHESFAEAMEINLDEIDGAFLKEVEATCERHPELITALNMNETPAKDMECLIKIALWQDALERERIRIQED